MKWLLILIIFPINSIFACTPVQAKFNNSEFEVCYFPETQMYISKTCKKVSDCFPTKNRPTKIRANQNPSFTLCYSIKGSPAFVHVSNSSKKVSFCSLNDKWVDLESLVTAQE